MNKNSLCIITPSFGTGGAERVLNELANYFVDQKKLDVHFIILIRGEKFYNLDKRIKVYEPEFNYKNYPRFIFTLKILKYLRKTLKSINPLSILSFGGRYNSFVLISSIGLGLDVFISERSRPDISYGKILDFINPKVYKLATGIIAQTKAAKFVLKNTVKHPKIEVIGNPVRKIKGENNRENIILNVGRFIGSKQQELLIDIFDVIDDKNWKLIFLGDGPKLQDIKLKANKKKSFNRIYFDGNVSNVDVYYAKSKIFAFTSNSEGFPNVLAESMSAGCACISFDCDAGPSDLIKDGINGYLIDLNDVTNYKEKLKILMNNETLRSSFGEQAKVSMEKFVTEKIGEAYFNFLFNKN